jgi:pimeloyl-ACP methyl ester carboxylesterase
MISNRFAENNGVRLSHHLHDRFLFWRPRLVLIQGVGFDAAAWSPVVRRLRRRFRLVVLDNRGVGGSDAAGGWYTVSTMVEDVVAVLDEEDIPEAHVLGVSLGGMVAQELAIRHPDRVDRLVLVSTTSGWPFTFPLPARSARLLAVGPMLPRARVRRRQLRAMMSRQSMSEQPHLAEQMSRYLSSLPHDPRSKRQQMMAGATYVGGLRQLKIRADTLVLHGAADTVADPRNATVLANQIAGAHLVMFPDAGHLLFWEHPGRFSDVVTAFLRRTVTEQDTVDAEGDLSGAVASAADARRPLLRASGRRSLVARPGARHWTN